jgi:glyoxylase I family protein
MGIELRGTVTLLEVFNVRTSIAFYQKAFDMEVVQSAGPGEILGWAWLRRGDVELMLNSMYDPGSEPEAPDPARIQAHADTTLYIGCPDVEGAYQILKSKGIASKPPVTACYGMKQLSFSDPDGYGICLQWPAE